MTPDEMAEHLRHAYRIAAESPDPSNQNGAVLVGPRGNVLNESCNRFPRGFVPRAEHLERPRKYNFIIHAEMGAVLGQDCTDCTLVCPWAACTMCARCIVESGVRRVVVHSPRMLTTPERWQQEVEDGLDVIRQAGVLLVEYSRRLNLDFSIKVNGDDWTP